MRVFLNLYKLRRNCGWTVANAFKSAWKLAKGQS